MKKVLLTFLMFSSILLTGCDIGLNTDNPINVDPLGNASDINPIKNPINMETLKTLTLDEAVNNFGQPYKKDSFIMADGFSAPRSSLYNFFSPEKYQNTDIQIQEYVRDKDMISMVTVRYTVNKDNVQTPINVLQRDKGTYNL